jgi:hypothetical protein
MTSVPNWSQLNDLNPKFKTWGWHTVVELESYEKFKSFISRSDVSKDAECSSERMQKCGYSTFN